MIEPKESSSDFRLETRHLTLIPMTLDQVRAMVDALTAEELAEVSDAWLQRLCTATRTDLWYDGFSMIHRESGASIGNAGFKGPPSPDQVVEIAYGVKAEHQGKGYATEAAAALTEFAFSTGRVRVVRAHTLPENVASARVLTKCGFQCLGEVIEPDDGLVWRWEKRLATLIDIDYS
jgi:RimJ/RimL family protein N-acetyltransferase